MNQKVASHIPHKKPRPTVTNQLWWVLCSSSAASLKCAEKPWPVGRHHLVIYDSSKLKFSHWTSRTLRRYSTKTEGITLSQNQLVALDTLQRSFNWLHQSSLANTLSPWPRRWIKSLVKMGSDLLKHVWQSEETHPGSGEQLQGPR